MANDKTKIKYKVDAYKRARAKSDFKYTDEILEFLVYENYHKLAQLLAESKFDLADKWVKENLL